jgi:hypothetical protein
MHQDILPIRPSQIFALQVSVLFWAGAASLRTHLKIHQNLSADKLNRSSGPESRIIYRLIIYVGWSLFMQAGAPLKFKPLSQRTREMTIQEGLRYPQASRKISGLRKRAAGEIVLHNAQLG